MKKAFINWSGGKDCTMALHKILEQKKYKPELLFTTISEMYQRVSMHGVRQELITRQAQAIGIHTRIMYLPESNDTILYEGLMRHEIALMNEKEIHYSVYGDIFLEDLKKYREDNLKGTDIEPLFPLWKTDTKELINQFIKSGYKAIIVSIDKGKLNENILGKVIDEKLINELPEGVDVCGENGEFHTFVFDGPIFKHPVKFEYGEKVNKAYTHSGKVFEFGFIDLI